ncbi:sulfotransferase [Crateriforma conspicua]|uniref:Sulfotransferase domain protein n=1 Tax=Crateriforma conspicua TaxID=2527996 RepID=A0A5C5Y0P5_9PLAN|nr:sulfotransferase [Crateriforma conspicua]TWT68754.1 hypothetical protein Pan14r_10010 [Crateriforma conspicua]
MPAIAAGFLSALIGLFLYHWTGFQHLVDRFLVTLGQSVYELNRYNLDDQVRLLKAQRDAIALVRCLFTLSLATVGIVVVSGLPFLAVSFVGRSGVDVVGRALLGSLPICVIYVWRLRRPTSADQYSAGKQCFYYLTLGVPSVGLTAGRVDRWVCGDRPANKGIIVTGLARAGTTAMLRVLHSNDQTWCLTYRQMPFPMAPRLWKTVNRARSRAVERTHRDGLLVDLDSPEAFDEFVWRVILKEHYYRDGTLHRHAVSAQQIEQFKRLATVGASPSSVYLSKNNNFLLRAESFLKQTPQYTLVLVYRDPIQHAQSLLRQHRLHCQLQQQSPFVLDYMDMLGHHEFGLNRRDFVFESQAFRHHDADSFDYWIERWLDYYRYALTLPRDRIRIIGNDAVRNDPVSVADAVLAGGAIDQPSRSLCGVQVETDSSAPLIKEAYQVFRQLQRAEV